MVAVKTPLYRFLAPRYWHVWLVLGLMRLAAWAPRPAQILAGRVLGAISYRLIRARRRIAAGNIARCFPELTYEEQQRIVRQHFDALGLSLVDLAHVWFSPLKRMPPVASLTGLDHLRDAAARGKGVILLLPHVTCTEMGSRLLLARFPFHPVYRPFENPLFQEIMHRRRTYLAGKAIPKDNIRQMLRSLADGHAVLYMPDQAYTGKGSVPAPFFSCPAPTNPGTARLARISGAPVVMFFPWWDREQRAYRLELHPALKDFPTDDALADATRINGLIESLARRFPDQYLWVHRRFKPIPTPAANGS